MRKCIKALWMVSLLGLTSCGDKSSSKNETPGPEVPQAGQPTEGIYRAILRPVNYNMAGWIPNGKADFNIREDVFEVRSWLDDAANVVHRQMIHAGVRCPTAKDDLNADGVVDFAETMDVASPFLIPLDADLSSQENGFLNHPQGNFSYLQRSSLNSTLTDLYLPDENPNDHLVKLTAGKSLDLAGRVLIVYGIADSRSLPGTIATIQGQTAQQSVPIACGVIERLSEN